MNESSAQQQMRGRAERSLRFRANFLRAGFGLLNFIALIVVLASWSSWYASTPGLSDWWHTFQPMLNTSTINEIGKQLATVPGGVPWPLIVMVVTHIVRITIEGALKLVFNYVNFQRFDRLYRRYESAMQREMAGLMIRERVAPSWVDQARQGFDTSSAELQRHWGKFRRWVEMYKEIPDEPEVEKVKAKRTPTEPQTVRLGEDGELVFEYDAEPEKAQTVAGRSN